MDVCVPNEHTDVCVPNEHMDVCVPNEHIGACITNECIVVYIFQMMGEQMLVCTNVFLSKYIYIYILKVYKI